MGVLEKIETWWESLGLTAKEANKLETLLDSKQVHKSVPVTCLDCSKQYNSTDFHDCTGRFDIIRVDLGVATNSVWKRLAKKYGIHLASKDEIAEEARKEISNMVATDFSDLVDAFNAKLKGMQEADPTWVIEEELWNA